MNEYSIQITNLVFVRNLNDRWRMKTYLRLQNFLKTNTLKLNRVIDYGFVRTGKIFDQISAGVEKFFYNYEKKNFWKLLPKKGRQFRQKTVARPGSTFLSRLVFNRRFFLPFSKLEQSLKLFDEDDFNCYGYLVSLLQRTFEEKKKILFCFSICSFKRL